MGWASYQEDNISRFVAAAPLGKSKPKSRQLPPPAVRPQKAVKASAARQDPSEIKQQASLKEFSVASARPLPVVIMADVSHSMSDDGKIDVLNSSIREMVAAFAQEDSDRAEIHIAVITFGGKAVLQVPLTPARDVNWTPAEARGRTPLGAAIDIATALIQDRDSLPRRSYRPTIVLASDGHPTDDWHGPLTRLSESDRSKAAQRFALAIGADADHARSRCRSRPCFELVSMGVLTVPCCFSGRSWNCADSPGSL